LQRPQRGGEHQLVPREFCYTARTRWGVVKAEDRYDAPPLALEYPRTEHSPLDGKVVLVRIKAVSRNGRQRSFAQHHNHDGAFAWANITLQMKDLLPGAQKQFTSVGGNSQSGTTQQCRLLIKPFRGPVGHTAMAMGSGVTLRRREVVRGILDPQCVVALTRRNGRLFSMKIIRCQSPVRNGYALRVRIGHPRCLSSVPQASIHRHRSMLALFPAS